MAKLYFAFACFVILLTIVACEEKGDPRVTVSGAWAPATAKGATTAAVYFHLKNTGAGHDKLVGVRTYEAASVALHDTEKDGDVMKMNALDTIPIPKRDAVMLAPGGPHLMLIDLTKPLTEGSMLTIVLKFEKSPEWSLQVPIKALDASGP